MPGFARILIILGVLLLVAGLVVAAAGRLNLPLGRLPGDISYRGRGWSIYVPLATSLLVSIVLSLVLWLINYFRR
jgi:Protein of unknown function (DUF2905)